MHAYIEITYTYIPMMLTDHIYTHTQHTEHTYQKYIAHRSYIHSHMHTHSGSGRGFGHAREITIPVHITREAQRAEGELLLIKRDNIMSDITQLLCRYMYMYVCMYIYIHLRMLAADK
jgi:hypothetical protein